MSSLSSTTVFRLVLFLFLAGLCAGCDSSSTTGPDSSGFTGTYSGTTEQGKTIQFTVNSDGGDLYISTFRLGIELNEQISGPDGGGCLTFTSEAEVEVGLQRLVINPSGFRIELPKDVPTLTRLPIDIVWDGSLSAQTASGVLVGEQEPGTDFGSCGGRGLATWTASKI